MSVQLGGGVGTSILPLEVQIFHFILIYSYNDIIGDRIIFNVYSNNELN